MPSDNFNRADGGVGANWTGTLNNHAVISNQVAANAENFCLSFWNADAFPDDQYSQYQITQGPGSAYHGVTVRHASGTDAYYLLTIGGAAAAGIYRIDDGTFTAIQTGITTAFTNGDVIRLEAEGATLRAYENGAQVGTDQTDATYTAGAAGIGLSFITGGAPVRGDDWEGGALAGIPIAVFANSYRRRRVV